MTSKLNVVIHYVMKTQKQIAEKIGVSQQFMSMFFLKKRTLSWKKAKHAAKVTNTDPIWWVEGETDRIKAAINTQKQKDAP